MNNLDHNHLPVSDSELDTLFSEALNRRRLRLARCRAADDLGSVRVVIDGESIATSASSKGQATTTLDEHSRLIEVFSGGQTPVQLANLIFSPVEARSVFVRLLRRRSYCISIDEVRKVKFTIRLRRANKERPYSLDIRLIDSSLPRRERLLAFMTSLTLGWGKREFARAAALVLVVGFGLLAAYFFTRTSHQPNNNAVQSSVDSKTGIEDQSAPTPNPQLASNEQNKKTATLQPKQKEKRAQPTTGKQRVKGKETAAKDRNGSNIGQVAELTLPDSLTEKVRSPFSTQSKHTSTVRLGKEVRQVIVLLPRGSPKGLYHVTITDPFRTDVMPPKSVTSLDGRSVSIAVNLRTLTDMEYRLCVAYDDEVPICRELIVNDQPQEQR